MEIIKNNYAPENGHKHIYERVCDKCKSLFRYADSDIEDEDRGLYGNYRFVVCPCCSTELGHYPDYNKEIKTIEE